MVNDNLAAREWVRGLRGLRRTNADFNLLDADDTDDADF